MSLQSQKQMLNSDIIKIIYNAADGNKSLKRVGIFGSYARGEQTTESDIDIVYEDIYAYAGLHDCDQGFCVGLHIAAVQCDHGDGEQRRQSDIPLRLRVREAVSDDRRGDDELREFGAEQQGEAVLPPRQTGERRFSD
ncbi:MAG: nucleotidyltransferase domain-containing protein [Oscillospiraceae bacterium]|nr:nucleotidyltransferase domain-containing protein [Oscillospiraceae bacterium]